MNRLILGDNLEIMKTLESESVDLIYLDPPEAGMLVPAWRKYPYKGRDSCSLPFFLVLSDGLVGLLF